MKSRGRTVASRDRVLPALKVLLDQRSVETQAEAARKLGVSRERVRQLINRHGLWKPRGRRRPAYRCPECHKQVAQKLQGVCGGCRRKAVYRPIKEFCVRGHRRTRDNLYVQLNSVGRRRYPCKMCAHARSKRWRARRRQLVQSGRLVLRPPKEFCVRGHKYELDPGFAKRGQTRCRECAKVYSATPRRNSEKISDRRKAGPR
jgi:hypothetical protein